MNPQYRFYIQIDDNSTRYQAYPIYGSDLSKNYSKESNQMFFRGKLDGKLKFVKSDFARIMEASFDSVIHVYIEACNDNKTWSEFFHGKFMRTDCTINASEQWLETKLEPTDNYEDVLAGLDKEFNLIELAPEMDQIELFKRPAIQIYIDGESVLTTFIGGTYFEQEVTAINVNNGEGNIGGVLNDMGFRFQRTLDTVTIKATNAGDSSADGNYVNFGYGEQDTTLGKVGGGDYKFRWYSVPGTVYDTQLIAELIHIPTNTVVAVIESEKYGSEQTFMPNVEYGMTANKEGGTVLYNWSFTETYIYARLLHDKDEIEGLVSYDLTSDDIASDNRNYRKASPIYISEGLEISLYLSEEPTEWGQYQPGLYFTRPVDYSREPFYPIGRSSWIDTSIWFAPTLYNELYDSKAREAYTLKHSYNLRSCISVLLSKIAPGVKHTAEDSMFFYPPSNSSGNSYNPISGLSFEVYLTQKTNILKGEYDQPAQKAMITLGQIFDMLKSCFQCYWYIEGDRLKIEHIRFFQSGKSYMGTSVGTDLTRLYDSKIRKPWSFGMDEYSFEKEEMPEWYQFEWADDVSFPFKGYPIEVVSKYVKKGNIENVSVANFVSDVDLMLLNPSAFTDDGMVLLVAVRSDDKLSLPFVSREIERVTYIMQNGYAAFCDLQERYYTRSLPAKKVIINKSERIVIPTRGKKQELEFPMTDNFDIQKLVRTSLGDGQVEDLKMNISSRMVKITLKHDTE